MSFLLKCELQTIKCCKTILCVALSPNNIQNISIAPGRSPVPFLANFQNHVWHSSHGLSFARHVCWRVLRCCRPGWCVPTHSCVEGSGRAMGGAGPPWDLAPQASPLHRQCQSNPLVAPPSHLACSPFFPLLCKREISWCLVLRAGLLTSVSPVLQKVLKSSDFAECLAMFHC